MDSDVCDNLSFLDIKPIELPIEIEYPTTREQENDSSNMNLDSISYINKLVVNRSEQFEIISKAPTLKKRKKVSNLINNLNKKRGRKSMKTDEDGKNRKSHNRIDPCNIRTKITIAYISFLVNFINSITRQILIDEENEENENCEYNVNKYELKKISYSKNINLDCIRKLKEKTIKDIVSHNISSKYIYAEKNENEKICQMIIEKNKNIEKILEEKYMEFFETIFYESKKKVNLSKYGFKEYIILNSNVVLFNDFIKKIKMKEKKNGNDLEQYLLKVTECVNNYKYI